MHKHGAFYQLKVVAQRQSLDIPLTVKFISVDRSSVLGNPFDMGKDESLRDPVCNAHSEWIDTLLADPEIDSVDLATRIAAREGLRLSPKWNKSTTLQIKAALRDIREALQFQEVWIGCWCTPKRCHADKYVELIQPSAHVLSVGDRVRVYQYWPVRSDQTTSLDTIWDYRPDYMRVESFSGWDLFISEVGDQVRIVSPEMDPELQSEGVMVHLHNCDYLDSGHDLSWIASPPPVQVDPVPEVKPFNPKSPIEAGDTVGKVGQFGWLGKVERVLDGRADVLWSGDTAPSSIAVGQLCKKPPVKWIDPPKKGNQGKSTGGKKQKAKNESLLFPSQA